MNSETYPTDFSVMPKSKVMNKKEIALIECYYGDNKSKVESAKIAGYKGSDVTLINIANRVLEKYSKDAPSKELFRQSGITEKLLASKLKDIILNGNDNAKLKAIEIAAKLLGLLKDIDIDSGATINIQVNQGFKTPDYIDGVQIKEDKDIKKCSIIR